MFMIIIIITTIRAEPRPPAAVLSEEKATP